MPKRKKSARSQRSETLIEGDPGDLDDLIPSSAFALERAMVLLSRVLKGQNFASPEQADAYVNKLLDDEAAGDTAATGTPLQEAQDMMFSAWESDDPDERIEIAEAALDVSADCADAYSLLGDEKAVSSAEARAYYEEAVRAGRRAIGEKEFEEAVGRFWDELDTRPYMRARERLAVVQWELGERESATAHMHELIRLNPDDGLGIRYLLFSLLLESRDDAVLEKLLAAYPDEDATPWLYDKARWLILRRASNGEIGVALDNAIAANPYVPAFLLGQKALPRETQEMFEFGGELEAAFYADQAKSRWVEAVGALEHLRQAVARSRKARSSDENASWIDA